MSARKHKKFKKKGYHKKWLSKGDKQILNKGYHQVLIVLSKNYGPKHKWKREAKSAYEYVYKCILFFRDLPIDVPFIRNKILLEMYHGMESRYLDPEKLMWGDFLIRPFA